MVIQYMKVTGTGGKDWFEMPGCQKQTIGKQQDSCGSMSLNVFQATASTWRLSSAQDFSLPPGSGYATAQSVAFLGMRQTT